MNLDKQDAFDDLQDILDDVMQKGQEAMTLIRQHFPEEVSRCEAYEVCTFGSSCNPHDTTLASTLEDIMKQDEEQMYDEAESGRGEIV